MRRRRQHLQVTTFPFLAVLLCALGSLILLLLVLDQKARRTQLADFRRRQAELAEERRREAERTAARQEAELRDRLADLRATRDSLRRQADDARSRLEAAAADSTLARRELEELTRALAAERDLARQEEGRRAEEEAARRHEAAARTAEAHRRRQAAETQLARLQEDVRVMEEAVAKLRELTARRPPVYSLVPYKGRQGINRPPLYLECVEGRVHVRPAGPTLDLDQVKDGRSLAEAIARYAPVAAGSSGPEERPYALFLIRPSGIPVYYAALRSIDGAAVDVGYEFISEDWVLDLTDRPAAPPEQVATASQGAAGTTSRPAGHGSPGAPAGAAVSLAPPQPDRVASSAGTGAAGKGEEPRGAVMPTRPPPTGHAVTRAPWDEPVPAAPAKAGPASPGRPTFVRPLPTTPPEPPTPAAGRGQVPPKEPPGAGAARGPRADGPRADGPRADGPRADGPTPGEGGGREPQLPQTEVKVSGVPSAGRPTPVGAANPREPEIVVVCSGDGVVVRTLGLRVTTAELAESGDGNRLVRGLADYVAARRAHNPDVRPRLKFLIRRDGLRTYYTAAGALEPLHLAATWELLADDAGDPPARR